MILTRHECQRHVVRSRNRSTVSISLQKKRFTRCHTCGLKGAWSAGFSSQFSQCKVWFQSIFWFLSLGESYKFRGTDDKSANVDHGYGTEGFMGIESTQSNQQQVLVLCIQITIHVLFQQLTTQKALTFRGRGSLVSYRIICADSTCNKGQQVQQRCLCSAHADRRMLLYSDAASASLMDCGGLNCTVWASKQLVPRV